MDFFFPKYKDIREIEEFIYRGINVSHKKDLSIQDLILYITIISGMHKNQERRSLVIMSMFDQDLDGLLNKQDLLLSFTLVAKITESSKKLEEKEIEELVEKAFKYDKNNLGMLKYEEIIAILNDEKTFFDRNFLKENIFDKLVETFEPNSKNNEKVVFSPQPMERRSSIATVTQVLKKGMSIFDKKTLELSPLKNRSESNGNISLNIQKSPKESPRLKNDMPPPESPRGIKALFSQDNRKSLDIKNNLVMENPRGESQSPKVGSNERSEKRLSFKIPKLFDRSPTVQKDSQSDTLEDETLVSPRFAKNFSDLFKLKSFKVENPIEEKNIVSPRLKKNESLVDVKKIVKSPRIFGIDMSKVIKRDNQEVPIVFLKLVDYLIEKNAEEYEGIFRISGKQETVESMINDFENGEEFDLGKYKDINCHASVLKQYLRSLPNPLLTYELFPEFMMLLSFESEEDQVKEIRRLIEKLPECNRLAFGKLLQLIDKIQKNSKNNMMNPTNLAVVFGVNCLRRKEEVSPTSMITENAKITKIFEELILLFEKYKDMFNLDTKIKKKEVLSANEILEKFLKDQNIEYVEVNDIDKPEPDFEFKKEVL